MKIQTLKNILLVTTTALSGGFLFYYGASQMMADDAAIMDAAYKQTDVIKSGDFEISPAKDMVFHRVKSDFGRSADFKTKTLCDVEVKPVYTLVGVPPTAVPMDGTETHSPYNCRSFNGVASNSAAKAEVTKMAGYLNNVPMQITALPTRCSM